MHKNLHKEETAGFLHITSFFEKIFEINQTHDVTAV